MARPSSKASRGFAGCASGAVLGLILGSLITALIVKATTDIPPRSPAAGYSLYVPDIPTPIVEGAFYGGFLGLIIGAVGGRILGGWMVAPKQRTNNSQAEQDAAADGGEAKEV